MALPPFDPSNEPLGSSDPRIRDLNTRNLDRAVNAKEPGKWWDRFGLEHPTLWLLGQLQEAANAIVGGGDDITQAWQSAIQNAVSFRIPESANSYTSSLAQGGPENRAPLEYSDRMVGNSGLVFRIAAPSMVARRAMINVPANAGRVIEVSILTGVPASEQLTANGRTKIAVAWYDNNRVRLEGPSESIFLDTADAIASAAYRVNFTIGSTDADIIPPAGAVYGIPFFEFDGTGFDFFAAEMSVTDVTQRRQIEQLQQLSYAGFLSLIDDDTTSDVFDFTNPSFAERRPKLGDNFPVVRAIIGGSTFSGNAETVRVGNRLMPGQLSGTPGRASYTANKALLPETGDFTFFGSTMMEGDQVGSRTLVWQNVNGVLGRVQCMLNGGSTGGAPVSINEVVGVWANGMTDGSGIGGYPAFGDAIRGKPVSYVIVMRDGNKASEFWLNGRLVDAFTRPASIAQTNTVLMGQGGPGNHPAGSYGRFGVIHRALDANEVAVAGQWCAAAYDDKWDREFLEGREVMPNALGGVSYLISGSSAPQKLNQYNDLRPLFLASFQQILYPASMTKVLTTMVMLDNIADMGAEIEMIEGDQTSGSGNNIAPGDILTISDAIYNMMLPSSNVTTSVVARVVGGMLLNGEGGDARARFVEAMNAKARQLGMLSSSFTNPSGLSDAAMVTTPEDMARLCANVPNYPEMFNRWGVTEHELNILGPNARTQIIGHSAGQILNARDDFQGGKTGTVFSSPLGSYSANFMWIGRAPNGNYTANVVMLVTDEDRYADASGLQSFVFDSLRWPLSFAVS